VTENNTEMPLVLASSSPRRQALLREAGIAFEVYPPPLVEPPFEQGGLSPRRWAEALSFFKARATAAALRPSRDADGSARPGPPERLILAADTVAALADRALGKARDADDARAMLRELSTHPHQVITGVTLLAGGRRLIRSETTTVFMKPMSAAEIDAYVASGEWVGKAGAYAIQETADRYVERIEGSLSNVVGLPIELLRGMLGIMQGHDRT